MTENGSGPGEDLELELEELRAPRTIQAAGREWTIEPPTGRKANRAFAILRGVSKEVPALIKAWGRFESEFEAEHYTEVPRAEAMLRFGGPQPLHRDGEPVYNAAGELVTIPSGLDGMSDEAWEAVGNVLRRPRPAENWQTATAVLAEASEEVERNVYRLVALFTIPNEEVARRRKDGSLPEHIDDVADELLDEAGFDELLELAAAAGEVVDGTFRAKAREIGASRLGKALRLLGVDPATATSQTPQGPTQTPDLTHGQEGEEERTASPSSSTPTSSTDSPADSPDGPPTPSSTPATSSSAPSAIGSSSRPPA